MKLRWLGTTLLIAVAVITAKAASATETAMRLQMHLAAESGLGGALRQSKFRLAVKELINAMVEKEGEEVTRDGAARQKLANLLATEMMPPNHAGPISEEQVLLESVSTIEGARKLARDSLAVSSAGPVGSTRRNEKFNLLGDKLVSLVELANARLQTLRRTKADVATPANATRGGIGSSRAARRGTEASRNSGSPLTFLQLAEYDEEAEGRGGLPCAAGLQVAAAATHAVAFIVKIRMFIDEKIMKVMLLQHSPYVTAVKTFADILTQIAGKGDKIIKKLGDAAIKSCG